MRLLRRNIVTTYGVYVASILSALVVTPIILAALGPVAYGLWATIGSFAVFLGLLDLGIGPAVVRFGAEQRGRAAPEETSALASAALVVYGAIAVVTMGLGAFFAWLIPVATDVPDRLVGPVQAATVLVVASFAVRFPLGLFTSLLLAQQRYDTVNVGAFASVVVYAISVVVVLAQGGGLVALGALTLAAALVRLAIPLAWIRRELPDLRVSPRLVTRAGLIELLAFSGHNILIHLAAKVVFSTDVIVVAVLLGPETAAYYAIPAKLFAVAFGFGTAGLQLLFSAFAELEGAGEIERQRRMLLAGIRIGTAVVLLVALPLAFLPDVLLEAWLGDDFDPSMTAVMVLLAATLPFAQTTQTLTHYLIARANHQRLALLRVVVVAVNLGISIGLVRAVGIWGVAVATLATEAISGTIAVPLLVRSASGLSLRALWLAATRPVLLGIGAALPALLTARLYAPEALPTLVPVGLLWVAVFGGAVWRFGLAESEREAVRSSLRLRDRAVPSPVSGEPV